MLDKIKEHIEKVKAFNANTLEEVEAFRIKYSGKKGLVNDFMADFRNVPNEMKKEYGQVINKLKTEALEKVNKLKEKLESAEETSSTGDLTKPGEPSIRRSRDRRRLA